MARKKKAIRRKTKKGVKKIRFQLNLGGVAGVCVVVFCLFLWMFLLGIWAGQTILLPSPAGNSHKILHKKKSSTPPVKILKPQGKKRPVAISPGRQTFFANIIC